MPTVSKLTRPISTLSNWDKNPRTITVEDFERLKRQIERLGQYKPLLITEDGVVLGGNMRLRAYRDLGWTDAWVEVVDAKTDAMKIEYALSDNDRAGDYDQEKLTELITNTPNINLTALQDYKVDLGKMTDIDDLLQKFGPPEDEPIEEEIETCARCGQKLPKDKRANKKTD